MSRSLRESDRSGMIRSARRSCPALYAALAAAALLFAILAGCGGDAEDDPLAGVPFAPDLAALRLDPADVGPGRDDVVRDLDLLAEITRDLSDPARRAAASDRLHALWSADPEHVLWPELAARQRSALDRPARFDSIYHAPVLADTSTHVGLYATGWRRVVSEGLGHRTHFLLAERNGAIEGILPLAEVRSRLFGHGLSSLPGCVYGGVAAEGEEARRALTEAARRLGEDLSVDALEMRNLTRREADWPCKDLYVTFRKEIDPDPEVNLKAIPRKQRAMVRKGIQAGLQASQDDGVERVHGVYAESVRNLGTPVFSKKYFRVLREVFGDDCGQTDL